MERPASGLLPGTNGLQIGVVQQWEKDKSGLARVKVLVPALKSAKSKGFVWARLGTGYAGKSLEGGGPRGMLFWPEKGDEVILGFFNDDPRYPVILGSMWSKTAELPFAVDAKNAFKGIASGKKMDLKFDDDKQTLSLNTEKFSVIIDQGKKSMLLNDKENKNLVVLNNKGITLTSGKDITLNAKKGNINLNTKNVNIKATKVATK